jgi:hypothetical protein
LQFVCPRRRPFRSCPPVPVPASCGYARGYRYRHFFSPSVFPITRMSNYGPKDAGLHPSVHSRAGQALFLYRFSEDAEPIERRGAGTELRKAVGELLICLFCLGPWVAAFFAYWLVLAPALTRFVASVSRSSRSRTSCTRPTRPPKSKPS